MTPTVLATRIAAGYAPVIVDVRSRSEYLRGHVPGAVHVPFWQVARRLTSLPFAREDRVVVYCGHGPRAWMAGAVLRRHGFRHVSSLEGHMSAWSRAGLPEERGVERVKSEEERVKKEEE